jgi:pleiotropic regulator 1
VLVTGGRDGVARVWDMRTRSNVHVLSGHTGTVADLVCQEADPQVITGSLDSTVRMWDLAAGKTMGVLTHHKKGVRALATHPTEFTFATGSTGSIKQWKCPEGAFMQNFDGHNAIINTMAVNNQNVFFSGGDNGSMSFWDWKSGHRFQALDTTAQPGSLDAESGLMSSIFDGSGSRLICGEADKTSESRLLLGLPGRNANRRQSKSGGKIRMLHRNHIRSNGSRHCRGGSFRWGQDCYCIIFYRVSCRGKR